MEKGEPGVVERAWILPPQSSFGTITDAERDTIIKQSRIYGKYEEEVNEVSATEKVDEENKKIEEEKAEKQRLIEEEKQKKEEEKLAAQRAKEEAAEAKQREREEREAAKQKEKEEKEAEKKRKQNTKLVRQVGNKFVNKATTKVVNSIWKGIFK